MQSALSETGKTFQSQPLKREIVLYSGHYTGIAPGISDGSLLNSIGRRGSRKLIAANVARLAYGTGCSASCC